MSHKNKSALHEKDGIEPPQILNKEAILKIKAQRNIPIDINHLYLQICSGDKVALSKGITLIESKNPKHQLLANQLLQKCLPHANNSIRIGITGVPGVGKSTFIEAFGNFLTLKSKKVAVLAIDPSSSVSHGSILGDKTRMEELVKNENAFIRPSAAGESLGGVAQKTRESIILCEACGLDTIIIETVGVGQSETAVHGMVDFFLLLQLAGAGDELQGIKRGIMEMADLVVINKADGENKNKANQAKVDFNRALHLFPPKANQWTPKVLTASALNHEGIDSIWNEIENFILLNKENKYFEKNRNSQNEYWLFESINEQLKSNFYQNPTIQLKLLEIKNQVILSKITPFEGANLLINIYNH